MIFKLGVFAQTAKSGLVRYVGLVKSCFGLIRFVPLGKIPFIRYPQF